MAHVSTTKSFSPSRFRFSSQVAQYCYKYCAVTNLTSGIMPWTKYALDAEAQGCRDKHTANESAAFEEPCITRQTWGHAGLMWTQHLLLFFECLACLMIPHPCSTRYLKMSSDVETRAPGPNQPLLIWCTAIWQRHWAPTSSCKQRSLMQAIKTCHKGSNIYILEGSLEVKLPTICTDEKQSRAEAERRERLEERRVEEKES